MHGISVQLLPFEKMLPNSRQHEPFSVFIADNNGTTPVLLKSHSPDVVWAKDQQEICLLIQTIVFKLILLDLNSCDLGLIKLIKEPDCVNKLTPVIGLIDTSGNFTKNSIIAAGFDDCLTTPLTAEHVNELFDLWQIAGHNLDALAYVEVMLRKTRNNRTLTLTILHKLFEELPHQVAAINEALTNNQYTVAEAVTHKLHGSVSLCGFTDMGKSADALENCLIKRDYQAVNSHFLLLQQRILNFTRNEPVILAHLKNVPDQNTKSP